MGQRGGPEPELWRSRGRRLLVLFGLSGFAISQPLLAVLGDNPITLAAHGVSAAGLIALALLVALVPPVALGVLCEAAARIRPALGRAMYLAAAGVLTSCALVQWLKAAAEPPTGVLIGVSVALAAAFAAALVRIGVVTAWASYTAALPLLAIGTFLAASPSTVLWRSTALPERARSDAPPVVLIVLDELPTRTLMDPDGSLDAARYPNLARFAADATWYRHHTTLAPFTENAVPSLLTGRTPRAVQPVWTAHPDNLFTLLAPTHDLEVLEAGTHLCPYDPCSSADAPGGPGFADLVALAADLWVDRVSPGEPAPDDVEAFNRAVEQGALVDPEPDETSLRTISDRAGAMRAALDADRGPTLYYLHLLLPHSPWRFRPDGSLYGDADPLRVSLPAEDVAVSRSWSPWEAAVSEQRHILQTQHTDALVGEVLDGLRDEGIYDEALVIVTADHGYSFEDRTPPRRATEDTLDAIAYTPLFVKRPGQQRGGVDDSNVLAIDVLPTIAAELGIALDVPVDGAVIGSPEVAARGGAKRFHAFENPQTAPSTPPWRFDDAEVSATVAQRIIGPLTDTADPLSGLDALLPASDVLGRRLDDLEPTPSQGPARLTGLDQLRRAEGTPLGVVYGTVDEVGDDDATALFAVDGVVVAGSRLSPDRSGRASRVAFLLPPGALDAANDVRVALIDADGAVRELRVDG